MSIELTTTYGNIEIANEVIAQVAGGAVVECYGIVGMASKSQLKDGLSEILRRENYSKGVVVRQTGDDVEIDLFVIVNYGTKISEIAHNVQQRVKYTLNKVVGLPVQAVNIYVQSVRVANE